VQGKQSKWPLEARSYLCSSREFREIKLKPATYTAPPSSPAMKQGMSSVQSYLWTSVLKKCIVNRGDFFVSGEEELS